MDNINFGRSSNVKIIHVLPVIRTSGGITLLQNILKNLPKNIKNQIWVGRIEEEIKFHKVKPIETSHAKINYFPYLIKIFKDESNKNTLIHIHGRNGFYVFLAAKLLKFKVIFQAHGYYYKLINKRKFSFLNIAVDKLLLKYSDLVLFCSHHEKDFILKNYTSNLNYKVIYNRSEKIKTKSIHNKKYPNKEALLYCLGTSNLYQKGIDRQLILIKELKKFLKNFMLIHYFNFQNKNEIFQLKNDIKNLGLSKHYILKSAHKNVWNEIDEKKGIIISTSRFETRNLVIQEAFHNSIPVVATNCIGQKELLNEQIAFILDNEDEKKWPKIIKNAILNTKERKKKVNNAKFWIQEFGDMKDYCKELISCYESIFDNIKN